MGLASSRGESHPPATRQTPKSPPPDGRTPARPRRVGDAETDTRGLQQRSPHAERPAEHVTDDHRRLLVVP